LIATLRSKKMGKGDYNGGSSVVGPRGLTSSDSADPRKAETVISVAPAPPTPRPAKGETWDDIRHLLPKGFVPPSPKGKKKKKKGREKRK
jgi:hypothetical protein